MTVMQVLNTLQELDEGLYDEFLKYLSNLTPALDKDETILDKPEILKELDRLGLDIVDDNDNQLMHKKDFSLDYVLDKLKKAGASDRELNRADNLWNSGETAEDILEDLGYGKDIFNVVDTSDGIQPSEEDTLYETLKAMPKEQLQALLSRLNIEQPQDMNMRPAIEDPQHAIRSGNALAKIIGSLKF